MVLTCPLCFGAGELAPARESRRTPRLVGGDAPNRFTSDAHNCPLRRECFTVVFRVSLDRECGFGVAEVGRTNEDVTVLHRDGARRLLRDRTAVGDRYLKRRRGQIRIGKSPKKRCVGIWNRCLVKASVGGYAIRQEMRRADRPTERTTRRVPY